MSDDELNDMFSRFKAVIAKDKECAVACVIVPVIACERRKRGDRDERARIERKADAKGMDAHLCQVSMSHADFHGHDGKQRSYDVHILCSDDEDVIRSNPFIASSYMCLRSGTQEEAA
jgi:hypothetical protein